YVNLALGFTFASLKANRANARLATSNKLCPASASKDREFCQNPVPASTTTKIKLSVIPMISPFPTLEEELLGSCVCTCECAISNKGTINSWQMFTFECK